MPQRRADKGLRTARAKSDCWGRGREFKVTLGEERAPGRGAEKHLRAQESDHNSLWTLDAPAFHLGGRQLLGYLRSCSS